MRLESSDFIFIFLVIGHVTALNPDKLWIVGSQYFGYAESYSGNVVAIGAYGTGGKGSVYLYDCSNYMQCQLVNQLQPNDLTSENNFGRSLAMEGNRLAVGASTSTARPGSVYRYLCSSDWRNCTIVEKLDGATLGATYFGYSVAMEGDFLVVGAPGSNGFLGTVFVLECPVGALNCTGNYTTLTTSYQTMSTYYGGFVTINGGVIMIGTLYANGAYLAVCTSPLDCGPVKRIPMPADLQVNSGFGMRGAIQGSFVAVSAKSQNNGTVYLYSCPVAGNITHCFYEGMLVSSGNSFSHGNFGSSVAIKGRALAIGANTVNSTGALYFYDCLEPSSCTLMDVITSPNQEYYGLFGSTVVITDNAIVSGGFGYGFYPAYAFSFPNFLQPPTPPISNAHLVQLSWLGLLLTAFLFLITI